MFSETFIIDLYKKSLKPVSDEWFNAICWSSLLSGIFIIKKCVEFSLTSFGTLKNTCVINTIEIFAFLALVDNSVTTFLLLIISAIISSKTMKDLRFLTILYYSIFS